jgi:hypothetical protein
VRHLKLRIQEVHIIIGTSSASSLKMSSALKTVAIPPTANRSQRNFDVSLSLAKQGIDERIRAPLRTRRWRLRAWLHWQSLPRSRGERADGRCQRREHCQKARSRDYLGAGRSRLQDGPGAGSD